MSKGNSSWKKIFDDYKILEHDFHSDPFVLSAAMIKKACQDFSKTVDKEVRILCSQNHRESRPKIMIEHNLFLLAIKNGIYALYTVDMERPVWTTEGEIPDYAGQIKDAIDQGDNKLIAKLIDKKVEFHAGGLSLEGLWATLSEYASATYESWADIKMDIDDGDSQQIPLILFKAIPKFPHSINKRRIE